MSVLIVKVCREYRGSGSEVVGQTGGERTLVVGSNSCFYLPPAAGSLVNSCDWDIFWGGIRSLQFGNYFFPPSKRIFWVLTVAFTSLQLQVHFLNIGIVIEFFGDHISAI